MRAIRAALVLLASTATALAQTPGQPCGGPVYNDTFYFVDATGHSMTFCVRERDHIRPDGGHRLRAAIHNAHYCRDASVLFGNIRKCHFSATVWCKRKTAQYLFSARFFRCREFFGRKNFAIRGKPLAAVVSPPGLSSVTGAFLSF